MNQDFTKVVDKHISILPEGLALREFSNRILINSLRYSKVYNREIINTLSETSTTEENHRELANILAVIFKDTSNSNLEFEKGYSILFEDIKKNPENDYAYWKAAEFYLRKNVDRRVRERTDQFYRKAIELNPENPDYYSYYGKYLRDNGKLNEALKYFLMADSVKQLDLYDEPTSFSNFILLRNIADTYYMQNNFVEAEKILIIIERKYRNEMIVNDFLNLITCYILTNQVQLAKKKCFECIKKYPSEAGLYYYLGFAYHREGDYKSAMKQYTKTIEIDSDHYEALSYKGLIYFSTGKFDSALVMIKKSINISPMRNEAYNFGKTIINSLDGKKNKNINQDLLIKELSSLVTIFEQKGMEEDASIIFQKLGLLYTNKENSNLAIENFKKALNLNPDNTEILINLGKRYVATNNNKEGLKYFLKALELKREQPLTNYNIGTVYYRLKKYNMALKYTQLSKKLGMDNRADSLIKNIETSMRNNKN